MSERRNGAEYQEKNVRWGGGDCTPLGVLLRVEKGCPR